MEIRSAIKEMDNELLETMIGYAARNGDPQDQSDKLFVQELCHEKAVRKAVADVENLMEKAGV